MTNGNSKSEAVACGFDVALDALADYQNNWDTGIVQPYLESERIAMECAVEAVRNALEEAKAAAPQAECAPREAQPRMVVLPNPETTYSAPWAGHTFKYHSNDQIVEYANACVKAAAPTPERADAEKDAALTNEKIEAAIEAWFDTDGKDVDDHQSRMRAAILAANKT